MHEEDSNGIQHAHVGINLIRNKLLGVTRAGMSIGE